jgi:LmbE family N-acetylglucosaminyl deacetylase
LFYGGKKAVMEKYQEYFYDGVSRKEGFTRVTQLGVFAHQDDVEFIAYPSILDCFGKEDEWFGAIVVTDGAGSPRNGLYADVSDEDMIAIRYKEQKKAAYVGEYGALVLLGNTSEETNNQQNTSIATSIKTIVQDTSVHTVYTHNPFDRHRTHVSVFFKTLAAIRALPKQKRPKKFLCGEMWCSLDWLREEDKLVIDVSERSNLSAALMGVFDSQISGGKRYDLAVDARRISNSTLHQSHAADQCSRQMYFLDLSVLIENTTIDPISYLQRYTEHFLDDITNMFAQTVSKQ